MRLLPPSLFASVVSNAFRSVKYLKVALEVRAKILVVFHFKCPLLLSDFNKIWNVAKSGGWALELLVADIQTDKRTDRHGEAYRSSLQVLVAKEPNFKCLFS